MVGFCAKCSTLIFSHRIASCCDAVDRQCAENLSIITLYCIYERYLNNTKLGNNFSVMQKIAHDQKLITHLEDWNVVFDGVFYRFRIKSQMVQKPFSQIKWKSIKNYVWMCLEYVGYVDPSWSHNKIYVSACVGMCVSECVCVHSMKFIWKKYITNWCIWSKLIVIVHFLSINFITNGCRYTLTHYWANTYTLAHTPWVNIIKCKEKQCRHYSRTTSIRPYFHIYI